MEGHQVTMLLTRPQASALWNAAVADERGGLRRRGQRWEVSFMSTWFKPATIDTLVSAGLLRRIGTGIVKITDLGHKALESDGRRRQGCPLPLDAKTLKQLAADADEHVPEITHNADGSIEFKCAGCGQPVFQAVDDGFGFPACFECRWFDEHPQLRKPQHSDYDGRLR